MQEIADLVTFTEEILNEKIHFLHTVSTENSSNEMEIATAEYKNHPSINAITEKMKKRANPTFGFDFTLYEETLKEINNLKIKISQKKDVSVKIVKESIDIHFYFLHHILNNSL